ncbi:MAG: histidinol phosphatase [Actinomycetota bacterium]|nr:histidinol phosphatase [Actinomycetota bacterium]
MTADALRADLDLALLLADRADEVTMAGFRRADLHVETKPDLTPVSEADQTAEQLIRAGVAEARPGDAVLGEEHGTTGTGSRRWIVDPIDGTKSYVRGLPAWATLIAVEVDGTQTVGVVSAPALGRRWWAARGMGAFAAEPGTPDSEATPIRVSAVRALSDAQLSGSTLCNWEPHGGVGRVLALAMRCWRDRAFGDFWSHVLVAEGACDIGLDPIASLWDLAALQVIVEEAGGRFTDLSGADRVDGGSAVSTNGLLHAEVLGLLTGTGGLSPAGP